MKPELDRSDWAKRLEQMVNERTNDLATVNLKLNQEIIERKRAEDELNRHLKHLDRLVELRTAELQFARDDAVGANVAMLVLLEDLRASEERLKLAQNAAGFGIFDRDIESGRLVWDARAGKIYGFGLDDLITFEAFLATIHPDDRANTQANIDQACLPVGPGDYSKEYKNEFRIIRRTDSEVRNVEAHGKVYFVNGRASRVIGVMRDITARMQLARVARDQQDKMNLLMKQQVAVHTASAIAHELNQPLVAISAFSEVALDMLQGGRESPQKLTRALQGAVEQAQRAGKVLNKLLMHLHKGDEGQATAVDLNATVCEVVSSVEYFHYDCKLVLDLERNLPPVLAQGLQLCKVLDNLLNNSVDAMRAAPEPGAGNAITVRTRAAGKMAQVTVQDSGPGLDTGVAARLFEPFSTTKPDGIGLGLVISRALVEAYGGRLWIDLDAEPGTTFHFTVPFAL